MTDFGGPRAMTPRSWPAAILVLILVAFPMARAAGDVDVYADDSTLTATPKETPMLAERVEAGTLPPVAERVPDEPAVFRAEGDKRLGRHGGDWRYLVGRQKDVRLSVVYGYARLVGYDANLELRADLLKRVEVEDGRVFTFHLREGHRWSDGHPFTTEDFRYWWEDVANNKKLSPTGPPKTFLVEGEPAQVTVIDETTIRYAWSNPNPFFLPKLAQARPLFIYRPAHYLKRYHVDYADPDTLAAHVEEEGARDWAQLHNRVDNLYRFDNPELPTLQPWWNQTRPPSSRFEVVRNPFFHRVDAEGRQLPYIDRLLVTVTGGALIPVKSAAGDADLQARGLNFSDYTFLKQGEERSGYEVRLWDTVRGSGVALYPNLNVDDPVWRELNRDARYRRALSLAINRHEINQVVYFGLGDEGNQSVLAGSPLHEEDYRQAYADFDLERANALLDEIGLTERNDDGIRLLPDGRPLQVIVETAGENSEETDILALIGDSWRKAGVELFAKPMQREMLRNRIFAGETIMTMWFGYENAVPTGEMSPAEFVPIRQYSYHWPDWGQYFETSGASGTPVDLPAAKELLDLYHAWRRADTRAKQRAIWKRILEIHAEQVFTIGLVARIPQPVVVVDAMENVPEKGIYNWDPGAHFGIYRPDTFFFSKD